MNRFLSLVDGSVDQIGSAVLKHCVESKFKTNSVEELARVVDTTPETLKIIIDGLTQPPGFDIRQSKLQFSKETKIHLSAISKGSFEIIAGYLLI